MHGYDEHDALIRNLAFGFLEDLREQWGDLLPWRLLLRGFDFQGVRVPLVSQQGIFKPRVLSRIPISIRTTAPKLGAAQPYPDDTGPDGRLRYCYRGTDPGHPENVGLRIACERGIPLIYFRGIEPGVYRADYPAFIEADDSLARVFTVAFDDISSLSDENAPGAAESALVRAYVTREATRRLHQDAFSTRVLKAYRHQCTVCRLRHRELLDAAHIIADKKPGGEPVVPNGLSMCKLHHAAFDAHVIGIRPDLHIVVREDVRREKDGPMLLHGLQGFHEQRILIPGDRAKRPDPSRLASRFEEFRSAS